MRECDIGRKRDNPRDPRRNVTDAARERKRRWQKLHYDPVKARARSLLKNAIDRGEIFRPDICEECKSPAKRQDGASAIHGHHQDYSKPLDVKWVCPLCHRKIHAALATKNPTDESQNDVQAAAGGLCQTAIEQ